MKNSAVFDCLSHSSWQRVVEVRATVISEGHLDAALLTLDDSDDEWGTIVDGAVERFADVVGA